MYLIPVPHKIACKGSGVFPMTLRTKIVLENTSPQALLYGQMIRDSAEEYAGISPDIVRGIHRGGDIVLRVSEDLEPMHHTVTVTENVIDVCGGSDEALLHGVTTLQQIIHENGAEVPEMQLEDWPEMSQRGYYQDLARGRIPTLAQLKKTADLLCSFKINEWQLYIEHTYMFRDFSEAWRDDTPLTAEEIMELDHYCAARHIELVPSLSTFGHMYTILSTKTYSHLCELPDSDRVQFSMRNTMDHHTLNVSDPGSMKLVESMIDEYSALFTSRRFNICCDETFDLAAFRSEKLGMEKGDHVLYISHVAELCSHLLEKGITPQFWGDILLHHPEDANVIPKGTVCLNWDYETDTPESKISTIRQENMTQYVCPGIQNWQRFVPDLRRSFANIKLMCGYGTKHGALGLLNTDWGDFGAVCPPDLSFPGVIYGAEFAWNSSDISFDEMNSAISALVYGDHTGQIMQAMTALSGLDKVMWRTFCQLCDARTKEKWMQLICESKLQEAEEANRSLDEGIKLLGKAALDVTQEKQVIRELRICAEAVRFVNEAVLYYWQMLNGREVTVDPVKLACDMENWLPLYCREWRRSSKESMLRHVTDVFIFHCDTLRGRKQDLPSDYLEQFRRKY